MNIVESNKDQEHLTFWHRDMILGSTNVLDCIDTYSWMQATHGPQTGHFRLRLREAVRDLSVDNGRGEWSLWQCLALGTVHQPLHQCPAARSPWMWFQRALLAIGNRLSLFQDDFVFWSWSVTIVVLLPTLLVEMIWVRILENSQVTVKGRTVLWQE